MLRFCILCVLLYPSRVHNAAIPNRNDPPLPIEDAKVVPNANDPPLPIEDAKALPNMNDPPLPIADAKIVPNMNVRPLPMDDAKIVPNMNDPHLPVEDANLVPNRNDAPLAIEDANILNGKRAPIANMAPNKNDAPPANEDAQIQNRNMERPPPAETERPMALQARAEKLKKIASPLLKTSDLQPPDHLDAVRLEQDGHLNHDFKKEVFAGNHEEFEEFDRGHAKKKLEEIFIKVDVNRDLFIEQTELENWIVLKVNEHFDEAAAENDKVFQMIDTDGDGGITWTEFQVEFLVAMGKDRALAKKSNIDDESLKISDKDREKLIRFKFRWAEADKDPQDNIMSIDEFKSFRHPEQSKHMLDNMVMDIISSLDKNGDGIVTEEEFIALPPGDVEAEFKSADTQWQDERRKEFRDNIDINHDGKTSQSELERYVDPRNPNNARLEAENLMRLADLNVDGKLSLKEVLDNVDIFIGSKMMDTGRSFHDEF
ncbi:45 kDa calcium-binding protein [Lamellibrachia satsuma]|nr:45 kDa calcium-binding protein [Lamellibrachia satsuma]